MICYLWFHKKHKKPYLGIVDGKKIDDPDLLLEDRSRMKILLIDAQGDIPTKKISLILRQTLELAGN